ncbi:MAG: triose-phosphate isomerase [Christensenellaceae bacterium]|nr:triose-phosphate isomerase [Christensenellaceae bacterium]
MMSRKPIIAGNWKMNFTPKQTKKFVEELAPLIEGVECDVVICAPFTDLVALRVATRGTRIKVGAQNVHWAKSGAYTGEISAEMLKAMDVKYVIIGHSERRQYFGETDVTVNMRLRATLEAGLRAIVCVGETLQERDGDLTNEILSRQVKCALKDIDEVSLRRVVIAYEPVWAIGTGKTATAQEAEDSISYIRKTIRRLYNSSLATAIRIQYGGSMNSKNVAELMAMESIDGGLIGGASLKAEEFAKVIKY